MTDDLQTFLKENIVRKNKKNPTLSKLTMIIPSYCRQDFIVRQCAYLHGRGASVVIVDGSPKPLSSNLQEIIKNLNDIIYVHSTSAIVDRIKYAATLIKTPYAVLCCDDEFLLESGLCSAISLLEKDKDLVACIGQSLRYYPLNNGSKCSYGTGYNTYKYNIRQNDFQNRLVSAAKGYNAATCYAVTRSFVWGKSWRKGQQYSSDGISELEHAFTTYIWGGLASVDDVYWMRSEENPPVETVNVNRISSEEWWVSKKFKTEKEKFVSKLGEDIVNAHQLDSVNAEAVVNKVFEVYLSDQKYLTNLSFWQKYRHLTLNILKNILPRAWVIRLIQLRNGLKRLRPERGNFGTLDDLKSTKTPLPFLLNNELVADLLYMEKLIADFYKARSL